MQGATSLLEKAGHPDTLTHTTAPVADGRPHNPLQDIGSGNCFVHNTLLFDHLQKSILYAPWRFHPAPFW